MQVKLEVIQDQHRFKQSSFGVQFYSCEYVHVHVHVYIHCTCECIHSVHVCCVICIMCIKATVTLCMCILYTS